MASSDVDWKPKIGMKDWKPKIFRFSDTPSVKELTSHMVDGVSCSAPPTYAPPQAHEDQFNYTAMLMAPLDDTNIGALY
ncbi:hypothetical protein MTR_4g117620 [Medicago truncatula]|uniref:Uncharacterized protein n=1 Tax=Medicago truncatula TaxID=3880 RepID=A0A072USA4_MEDTR|nr:hypothetical protein MTR_4g117620 [Medicago truncatula]